MRDDTRLRLLDLEANECRWPVERDNTIIGSYIFCGMLTEPSCVFCSTHARTAYVPVAIRRPRKRD